MNESNQKMMPRRDPLAAISFYIICILLFPVMLVGYVLWVGKVYAGRTSGVSGTAQGPLSAYVAPIPLTHKKGNERWHP